VNNLYRFKPDITTIISLKRKKGKPFKMGETTGFTYTLSNGLTCRVSDQANTDIQALHLDAGTPFMVTKRTLTPDTFTWEIERVAGGSASDLFQSTPDTVGELLHSNTLSPAILKTNHGRDVLMHLIGAIEIAHAAENYAKSQLNRIMRFSPNDIRALAISCFIQQDHQLARDLEHFQPMVSPVLLTPSANRLRVSGSAAR
jgi:hypothetical protein